MIKPSSIEQSIGLTTFLTNNPGIGGVLRVFPKDFIVNELSKTFPVNDKGRFLLVKVTAKNWETNDLIRAFAKKLHISKKRISFAGTKDKRAITTQILCFYRVKKEQISSLSIPDVTCEVMHYTNNRLSLGDLIGNKFTITIRKVSLSITQKDINEIIHQLQALQGFPNFFGVQRFGSIRPVTHKIGRAMVAADFKKAVMIYLTEPSDFEAEDATIARKKIAKTHDFNQGFQQFPKRLRFEKILMQHLTEQPDDYTGALKRLPGNLLTMFVYAFQSYLFNRMLSQRIKKKIPLNKAVEGDIILPVTHKEVSIDPISVSLTNIDKVNEQIKKGKAVVSCVLPGSETKYAEGVMGQIQRKIIEDEQVDIRDFIIPEVPTASSYGTHRPLLSPLHDLSTALNHDEYYENYQKVTLSFSLRKGSYATTLLREIMKLDDITNY